MDGGKNRLWISFTQRMFPEPLKPSWIRGVNGEVYNIRTGVETSIRELARMVMDVFGIGGEFIFEKAR